MFAYPVVHAVHCVAPAFDHELASQTGHVLSDLYAPATQVSTIQRLETELVTLGVVPVLLQLGVAHVARFAIDEHVTEHVVLAFVLYAVPVPDVVRPPGHAVHVLAPAALYDPAAHSYLFISSL